MDHVVIAAIISGEADMADVWFLIATILAFLATIYVVAVTRDVFVALTAGAIGFLALGLLFV